MKHLKNRIRRLENRTQGEYASIYRAIDKGMYFDQLTVEERNLYESYKGYSMLAVRDIELSMNGYSNYPHIKLEYNPKPPTQEDIEATKELIEKMINEARLELDF